MQLTRSLTTCKHWPKMRKWIICKATSLVPAQRTLGRRSWSSAPSAEPCVTGLCFGLADSSPKGRKWGAIRTMINKVMISVTSTGSYFGVYQLKEKHLRWRWIRHSSPTPSPPYLLPAALQQDSSPPKHFTPLHNVPNIGRRTKLLSAGESVFIYFGVSLVCSLDLGKFGQRGNIFSPSNLSNPCLCHALSTYLDFKD